MKSNYDFKALYGMPNTAKANSFLTVWDVPTELEIGVIPKKIYCNKNLIAPLTQAFKNLIETGCVAELKTWDGCYNYRPIRGYEKKWEQTKDVKYLSAHSWGCAIDVNAAWNGLGKKPQLSAKFVKCFTDAGFTWGGNFSRPDGMHFQL